MSLYLIKVWRVLDYSDLESIDMRQSLRARIKKRMDGLLAES